MLDKGNSNTGSAMVLEKDPTKGSTSKEKPFTKSSYGEYCTYCKRSGHTKDTCYKRYGKKKVLERMSGNKGSAQMWDIQAFSKEEMDRLRALLNSTSKPLGSCDLTMNGKSSFNISGLVPHSIWILDFGVTDHMTLFPSHFTSYLKVPKRQLITVANGDHVPIAGSGNVQLHSSLSLHNELRTGRMIGVAKEQGGLYYLQHTKIDNNINKEELSSSQQATSETWTASQIWLYHKRLGHPPFGLRSDNGTEFVNLEFFKFLKDNGVVHELTCENTPQQNGVVKRKNRHFLEVARALLFQMSIPNVYWGEFVLTIAYLINRLPTQGESYLEVEPIFDSLPFPTQDVQVQVQEVMKLTLVLEQVQMSKPDLVATPQGYLTHICLWTKKGFKGNLSRTFGLQLIHSSGQLSNLCLQVLTWSKHILLELNVIRGHLLDQILQGTLLYKLHSKPLNAKLLSVTCKTMKLRQLMG
ncbi:hypothetical protein CR513_20798, partial [Mucuna pruriens]